MKLSLECAMRFAHKGFIEVLTNNDNPKFTYLGEDPKSKFALLFETDCDDADTACALAKKIAKSSPLGASATIRVVVVE
ncbi:MAG: hypothetical protein MSC52_01880 [Solobacterium sp.]|nr:hypothetical protein [Solobacterium sp.]MDY5401628.1 hypothetical protein [Erysipelotrichaceae bacterium]